MSFQLDNQKRSLDFYSRKMRSQRSELDSKNQKLRDLEYELNTYRFAFEDPDPSLWWTLEELAKNPENGKKMDSLFMEKLAILKQVTGLPFKINSAYRTPHENFGARGVKNSAHKSGYAIDVRATRSDQRFLIVKEAIKLGFNRIGIHARFIHLDMDPTKTPEVI